MKSKRLLVVVHPGSLFGSADMHLGRFEAREVRAAILREVRNFQGPVAVVDGDFADELEGTELGDELKKRAVFRGPAMPSQMSLSLLAKRLKAVARKIANHFKLPSGSWVVVTGAWNDNDGTGCVTAVAKALNSLGFWGDISDNAPAADGDGDDEGDCNDDESGDLG